MHGVFRGFRLFTRNPGDAVSDSTVTYWCVKSVENNITPCSCLDLFSASTRAVVLYCG